MLKYIVLLVLLSTTNLLAAQDTTKPKKDPKVLYGIATFYSNSFDGKKTATGEIFRQNGYTAASNNIPLGTWVKVTNVKNNKTVTVKINDRMAPSMARKGRVVDLTRAAAEKLNFITSGTTKVKVTILGKKKPLQ